MRLRIVHTTTYRYARPVTFHRHRLVLRPREGHDLQIERMVLEIQPAHRLVWTRDVFGNSIALVDWLEPSDMLSIVSDLVVVRVPPFPSEVVNAPWRTSFPPDYDALEMDIVDAYRRPSFPESATHVREWVGGSLTPIPDDGEGTMLALCELVQRSLTYERRPEKGVQSPTTTLGRGRGSCRDFATLMMEAARALGVAVRFASGYLHGTASMAGHASTHAWCEVYLPTLGWRGFDPTIGMAVSLRHVIAGVSSHPRGVMPVSGTFIGSRSDSHGVEVSVRTEELPEPA